MKRNSSWETVSLDDVAKEVTVGYVGPMTHEYCSDGIPFLRSKNVKPYLINQVDIRYIGREFHQRIRKSRLSPGDVVIVRTGNPGITAIIPDWLEEANCSDLVIVRPGNRLNSKYFVYFMNAIARHQVDAHIVGAVQQHFNVGSAKTLQVSLPSISEQQRIVSVLGALDDKIEINREMNHTLEATAQAIFKSWFLDFDPVTAKAEGRQPYGMTADTAALFPAHFVESDMGPIPEGWNVSSIADLARYVNGKNFTKNATGSGRMVIRIAELNSGPGASTVYNEVEANEENTAYPGDLLFSWSGSLDVYRWHQDEALVNQHIFKVIPQEFPQWFVYFQLREAISFFQGIAADKATTMGHIKREHLSQAKLVLPPAELIAAMDGVVKPMYQRIHQNEGESITLASIRDSLLPRLLSGEIRVEQAEQVAEEIT